MQKENLDDSERKIQNIEVMNEDIFEIDEDVSRVIKIPDESSPHIPNKNKLLKTFSLVVVLIIAALIVGFLVVDEFDSQPEIIIAQKNDPIRKVLDKLRQHDVKINYHFVSRLRKI